MKNKKLKGLLLAKAVQIKAATTDIDFLNKEQIASTIGGASANCPKLVSCGLYNMNNCPIKIG